MSRSTTQSSSSSAACTPRPHPTQTAPAGNRRSRGGSRFHLASSSGPPPSARSCPRRWAPLASGSPHAPSGFPPRAPAAEVGPRRHPIPDLVQVALRSFSKSAMDTPSTPGAPLFALTFSHASQTSRFEISNGLPGDFSSSTRLLPENFPVDRTNTATNDPAPSLRPHYRGFTTTTSRSASAPRDGTQPPRFQPLGDLPLARRGPAGVSGHAFSVPRESRRPGSRRLHAGHHLASKRTPAKLIPGSFQHPGFDVT